MEKTKTARQEWEAGKIVEDVPETPASPIVVTGHLFRRRPLLVRAEQIQGPSRPIHTPAGVMVGKHGDWLIQEAGTQFIVPEALFPDLYEVADVSDAEGHSAGLRDYEPGAQVHHGGERWIRVEVSSGRGAFAYWHRAAVSGAECAFKVVADMIDNVQASHRVGRFVEPFEGKPGSKAWVRLD